MAAPERDVLCQLVLVIGWSRGFPSPRRRSRAPAARTAERAARRYRHPAFLQVPDAADSHRDRVVIDPGQQVVQRRVLLPGRLVLDPAQVSGPSPHRLVTQFVIVLARRCPGVSHSLVRAPAAAPETRGIDQGYLHHRLGSSGTTRMP